VTHITGLLLGFLMPWSQGAGAVLMDQWDAERALDLILDHGCTFTGGAPPFIRGLIDATRRRGLGPDDIPLTRGPCGGADVPPSLIREAADVLGARFTRIYGSTEGVTVTGAQPDQPFAFAAESDGPPLPGHEIRIVDDAGRDLPPGVSGEILIRGPSNFVGYFDPALNADCFDKDGFFRMGDLGQWDAGGCIRIQGRKKDIIIRNGENIAAKEVEDLLITHELVREVALVGVPDPDTGERACAYVVPADGTSPTLADLCGALQAAQIARQKYPEFLVLVDALPKTASGKVQKYRLRDDARARGLNSARS
jgi:cyclohexanecarboxylate-CoA ligase